MLPGQRFELDGNAVLSGGRLRQKSGDGELNLTFTSATASWGWREEALSGTLFLTTAEYGQVRANFQLPVPARFPVAVTPKGVLKASLVGQLQEKGIISALFPELVQKSFGEIDTELTVGGSWDVPQHRRHGATDEGGCLSPCRRHPTPGCPACGTSGKESDPASIPSGHSPAPVISRGQQCSPWPTGS